MATPAGKGRRRRDGGILRLVPAMLLAGGLLVVYWSTVSHHYSGDGILYAGAVEAIRAGRGGPVNLSIFLHPHHLLYNPLGYLFHLLWPETTPAVVTLALANGLAGAVAVALLVALAWRLGLSNATGLLAGLTLGLSHGFWLFAVTAETYLLAQAGVLAFLIALVGLARREGPAGGAGGRMALAPSAGVGAAWVLAVLGHVTNVLLAVPLVVVCAARRRLREAAAIVAVSGAATLAVYLVAARLARGETGPGAVARYLAPGYAPGDYLGAGILRGPLLTARAVIAGFGPSLAGLPVRPGVLLAAVGAAALAASARKSAFRLPPAAGPALAATAVSFFLLFSVWDAGNIEFALWLLPPACIGLAVAVERVPSRSVRRALLGVWTVTVVLAAAGTYGEAIGPATEIDTNRYLKTTRWLAERTADEDLLFLSGVGDSAQYKFYLPYFAGRRSYWLDTHPRRLGEEAWRAEIARMREAVRSGRLRAFCMDELFREETLARLAALGVPAGTIRALAPEFRVRDRTEPVPGQTVALLEWSVPGAGAGSGVSEPGGAAAEASGGDEDDQEAGRHDDQQQQREKDRRDRPGQ